MSDCGSELVASADLEPFEGTHTVFECNSCGTCSNPTSARGSYRR